MTRAALAEKYRGYIACLNAQAWGDLRGFVHADVAYNDRAVGLAGYRAMLEGDFVAIPDLVFAIRRLVVDPPHVAACLHFDCTPAGTLFGLRVDGRRVRFDENVVYAFEDGRIREVWSIIDKAAIADQIGS